MVWQQRTKVTVSSMTAKTSARSIEKKVMQLLPHLFSSISLFPLNHLHSLTMQSCNAAAPQKWHMKGQIRSLNQRQDHTKDTQKKMATIDERAIRMNDLPSEEHQFGAWLIRGSCSTERCPKEEALTLYLLLDSSLHFVRAHRILQQQ